MPSVLTLQDPTVGLRLTAGLLFLKDILLREATTPVPHPDGSQGAMGCPAGVPGTPEDPTLSPEILSHITAGRTRSDYRLGAKGNGEHGLSEQKRDVTGTELWKDGGV